MSMHNPPHPGEFIKATFIDPFDISQNELADELGVARSTFNRLIRGLSGVSPEMALRLSVVLGRTPESWLSMQAHHDLHKAKRVRTQLKSLRRFNFDDLAFAR